MRWTWLEPYTGWLFLATLLFNLRAAWKLAIDWAGMLTTVRFVRAGYARRGELPPRRPSGRRRGAPVFLTLVAAYQEPAIASTLRGLLALRYPAELARYVVVTKAAEDAAPHPAMPESTGHALPAVPRGPAALRRQAARPPRPAGVRPQGRAAQLGAPARGARADPRGGCRGSVAGVRRRVRRRLGARSRHAPLDRRRGARGPGGLAYQGVTLSLANWRALGIRGRICAIQQSSIFTRVSLARLVNEVRRIRLDRPRDGPDPGPRGRVGPGGARALLPPLPDLPRTPSVRPARRAPGPRRIPDGRGDGGLDARIHAGRARDPDPPDADDRADGSAGDEGEDRPPERALVPGRARRRRLPLGGVARRARRRSTSPSSSATSSTRSWSGRSPPSSTRPWDTSAGTSPTRTGRSTRSSSSSRWRCPRCPSGSPSGSGEW